VRRFARKPELLLPVDPLLNLLRTQAITTVTLPPSVWAVLPSDDLPSLAHCDLRRRSLFVTDSGIVGTQRTPLPECVWTNGSHRLCDHQRSTRWNKQTADRKTLANTRVHILDVNLRQCPWVLLVNCMWVVSDSRAVICIDRI
jgi:hypothetical protein